jgi:hypothetical protein
MCDCAIVPQSIQSVRLSLKSSELAPPPHSQASVAPPPLLVPREGRHTRLKERGRGEPIRTKDRHSGTLGICSINPSTDRTYKVGVNL